MWMDKRDEFDNDRKAILPYNLTGKWPWIEHNGSIQSKSLTQMVRYMYIFLIFGLAYIFCFFLGIYFFYFCSKKG